MDKITKIGEIEIVKDNPTVENINGNAIILNDYMFSDDEKYFLKPGHVITNTNDYLNGNLYLITKADSSRKIYFELYEGKKGKEISVGDPIFVITKLKGFKPKWTILSRVIRFLRLNKFEFFNNLTGRKYKVKI